MPYPLKPTCQKIRVAAPFVCPTMQGVVRETVKPRTSKGVKMETFCPTIRVAGQSPDHTFVFPSKTDISSALPGRCLIRRLPTRQEVGPTRMPPRFPGQGRERHKFSRGRPQPGFFWRSVGTNAPLELWFNRPEFDDRAYVSIRFLPLDLRVRSRFYDTNRSDSERLPRGNS
jgi:hypothetical protein